MAGAAAGDGSKECLISPLHDTGFALAFFLPLFLMSKNENKHCVSAGKKKCRCQDRNRLYPFVACHTEVMFMAVNY